jgi:hypothetical protein
MYYAVGWIIALAFSTVISTIKNRWVERDSLEPQKIESKLSED